MAGATWAWVEEAQMVGAYALLGALLIASAALIVKVARWAKQRPGPPLSPDEELEQYRTLMDEDELSREEFERIRARLTGQPPSDSRREPPAP